MFDAIFTVGSHITLACASLEAWATAQAVGMLDDSTTIGSLFAHFFFRNPRSLSPCSPINADDVAPLIYMTSLLIPNKRAINLQRSMESTRYISLLWFITCDYN
jgi:hypothetical protein